MDDVKAVIEQATDAAMGTPPEAPKPEMGTPEAPVEAPNPERKKVRRARLPRDDSKKPPDLRREVFV